MDIRFSLLDLDINTKYHTYGLFLGNLLLIDANEFDRHLLRVEYNVVTGWELEVLGLVLF